MFSKSTLLSILAVLVVLICGSFSKAHAIGFFTVICPFSAYDLMECQENHERDQRECQQARQNESEEYTEEVTALTEERNACLDSCESYGDTAATLYAAQAQELRSCNRSHRTTEEKIGQACELLADAEFTSLKLKFLIMHILDCPMEQSNDVDVNRIDDTDFSVDVERSHFLTTTE